MFKIEGNQEKCSLCDKLDSSRYFWHFYGDRFTVIEEKKGVYLLIWNEHCVNPTPEEYLKARQFLENKLKRQIVPVLEDDEFEDLKNRVRNNEHFALRIELKE